MCCGLAADIQRFTHFAPRRSNVRKKRPTGSNALAVEQMLRCNAARSAIADRRATRVNPTISRKGFRFVDAVRELDKPPSDWSTPRQLCWVASVMMRSRLTPADAVCVTIRPRFAERATAAMSRSITPMAARGGHSCKSKELVQERRCLIRDAGDLIGSLAIEFEIKFGFGLAVMPITERSELAAP